MNQSEQQQTVIVMFESRQADILTAIEVINYKNRLQMRRGFQYLGVGAVLWMFVPELLKNPAQIVNWLMVAAAVGLAFMLWKYPAYENRRYADSKVKYSPQITLHVTDESIVVTEGTAKSEISFAGSVCAYEYQNVIAVNYEKNHLLTIPKDQLEEAQLSQFKALLEQGLGDRYEQVALLQQQEGFSGRGK